MKHMIIDGTTVEFENARNVLEVARQNGFDIPNLCYCENLSIYGGCRMCVVENDRGKIEAACTMVPKDGLSPRCFWPATVWNAPPVTSPASANFRSMPTASAFTRFVLTTCTARSPLIRLLRLSFGILPSASFVPSA